jgi:hypothetical protein
MGSCNENTYSIDGGTRYVQYTLQNKPGNTHLSLELGESEQVDAVQHGNNSTCTHGNKHACTERTPFRCSEAGENGHNRAADTNERYL